MKLMEGCESACEARVALFGVAVLLAVGLAMGPAGVTAHAAEPPLILWGEDGDLVCPSGSGAAQCDIPRGVAADPENGHIFVADQINFRIDEFNALGQFVKAWGWGVDTGAGELQICTEASVCQAGITGGGTGQFSDIAPGIALDSAGNVYVTDRGFLGNPSVRVQKFSPDGQFLLTFGGEVNKTKVEAGGSAEAEENLCPFDLGDQCQKGTVGTGQGQFGEWAIGDFIAIDDNGTEETESDDKVYVGDVNRIQRFDSDGHYQAEIPVTGTVQGLDVDDDGNLYAIYGDEVHKLSPAGVPLAPEVFELEDPDGSPVSATAVAVDPAGNVFAFGPTTFSAGRPMDPIFEFDPEGNVIAEFGQGEFSSSTGLATNLCQESDPPGNLYVTNASSSEAFLRAYGSEPIGCFKARTLPADPIGETTATLNGTVNPKGEAVTDCFFEYGTTTAYGQEKDCEEPDATGIGTGSTPVPVHADVGSLERGIIYHFRLIAEVGGETEIGADEDFKTFGPPVISDDHTAGATDTEATLKAVVNPEGFATACHFEYTTQANFEVEGFEGALSTEAIAAGKDGDTGAHPVVADITGLTPGTTYRWRIVCGNASDTTEGAARTFTTFLLPGPGPECANSTFRTGASAFLPDCRAYEMVSPVDKNGGDIVKGLATAGESGGYVQAGADDDSLTYTTLASFGKLPGAVNFNQYLATRQERGQADAGWLGQGIHPPVAGQSVNGTSDTEFGVVREFMGFSPDLCSAWVADHQTPPPTADGQAGYPNLYRRDNCGDDAGGLEALVPSPEFELPPGASELYVDRRSLQGFSTDSRHAIFAAQAQLTSEANDGTNVQLYDRFCPVAASEVCGVGEGSLALVSVLPDGSSGDPVPGDGQGFASPQGTEVGGGTLGRLASAVSNDGSRVYWASGGVYLRLHPEQGIVSGEFTAGQCSAPAAVACTISVSASDARFRAAAADGSRALYTEGGDLYEFALQRAEAEPAKASQLIAKGIIGVIGASEDLARIYFVSTEVLPGAGANSEGDEAVPGEANLYLEEEGSPSFVATLVTGDVGAKEPGTNITAYNLISRPYENPARVTPEGEHLVFQSRGSLTGYDNTLTENGRPAVEVFSYEAGGELLCVSCNPSEGRPNGSRELASPYAVAWEHGLQTKVSAAAWIPTWEHPLHASNVLSADGARLFFNSNDALLPRDTNGAQDVYEWEAPGAGSCDEGDADYFPRNGGCLYLISTGESPFESEFWEASPGGGDVFFTTESSLLSQDPGSVDLYDARALGGFLPPPPIEPCEGEACQTPPTPPGFPTGASATYSGPGNPPKGGKQRCPKGKRKVRKGGKVRCVKKRTKQGKGDQRRRANQDRRVAR